MQQIALLFLLFTFFRSTAAEFSDSTYNNIRAKYIIDKTHYLNIRVFSLNNIYQLKFNEPLINPKTFTYQPNLPTLIGFGFNYHWLGLGVSFINPGYNADTKDKGKTEYFDLFLNSYSKKFAVDAYFIHVKGYYLSNLSTLDFLNTDVSSFKIRSDMNTHNVGANFYYFFNHKKYSFRASFIQTEIQKKSSGSFVLNPYFSYYELAVDHPLIKKSRTIADHFRHGNFFTLGVGPGYAHTFVLLKRFYFTLGLFPSFYLQYQNQRNDNTQDISRLKPGLTLSSKIAFGYNGNKFFVGISGSGDTYTINLDNNNAKINYVIGSVRLSIGYRIPLFLKWFPFKNSNQYEINKN